MNVSVFLTLVMTFLPIAVAQETQPANPEAERQAQIQELQKRASSLPQVKADSIQQLVRFSIEENMLAARTQITSPDPQESEVHVTVPGLKGVVFVSVYGPQDPNDKHNSENVGRNFQIVQNDLTNPAAGTVITHVQATGGRLIVARDSENEQAAWNIQLIQDPPTPAGTEQDEEPVRLLVQRNDESGNAANNLDLKLSGKTFIDLRRKHPAEVNQYFRPIIREFGQEAEVFGVPAPVAWEVLGMNYAPDQEMTRKVNQILAKLDADNFRDRENALEELKKLGQPAAIVLAKIDRSKLSLQQSSGVETFLAEFAPLAPAESARLANDKDFLIDVLYNQDPTLVKLAQDQLSNVIGHPIRIDPGGDAAARADAIAKLRQELLPPTVTTKPAPASGPTTRLSDDERVRWQF
jgi:hypothetical protein